MQTPRKRSQMLTYSYGQQVNTITPNLSATHHLSGCCSFPKEEPLSTCCPQLLFRNVTPRRSYISDQVVAPSRSWSASRSFMSTEYPFCDPDCPSVVMSPRHLFRSSVFAFSYIPDSLSHHSVSASSLYSFCP